MSMANSEEIVSKMLRSCLRINPILYAIKLDDGFGLFNTFSQAKFRADYHKTEDGTLVGIRFWRLFSKAQKLIKESIELEPREVTSDAFIRLREFLEKARKIATEIREVKIEEEQIFNVFIGKKVLIPLSGGKCIFNTDHNKLSSKLQRGIDKTLLPKDCDLRGLAFGHHDAYYGEPDMIVVRGCAKDTPGPVVVTVAGRDKRDEAVEGPGEDSEDEEAQDPGNKRLKLDSDVGSESDTSPGKTQVEGKKKIAKEPNFEELSQVLATVIAFTFVQKKRHNNVTRAPTIRIHPAGFDILIYDCAQDVLLGNFFYWDDNAFPYLWAVLHYGAFLDKECQLPLNVESGYIRNADFLSKGFPHVQGNPTFLINKLDFATKTHEIRRIDCRFCDTE